MVAENVRHAAVMRRLSRLEDQLREIAVEIGAPIVIQKPGKA